MAQLTSLAKMKLSPFSASRRNSMAPRRVPVVVLAAARPIKARPSTSTVSHATLSAPLPNSSSTCSLDGMPKVHPNDAVWLQEKLNDVLGGLTAATRRAKVRALRVLHVTGARMSYNPQTQRPRCTGLDLDIAWEAQPLGAAAQAAKAAGADSLHGMARVKLTTRGCDKVEITDVQVLDKQEADGSPSWPSSQAAPPDVLLAVQSLDGAIMEQLNGFMWELEQAKADNFPLSSFELDEEEAGEDQECPTPGYSTTSPSAA